MSLHTRIREVRERAGLTQKAFGAQIGRTDAYICQIEKGKILPPTEVLSEIAETFCVSPVWLAEGKGTIGSEKQDEGNLGKRLREARKKRHYTQEELAEASGCSRNAIGLMERGGIRPAEKRIRKLSEVLWIREEWLRTGRGGMERDGRMAEIYELLRKETSVREEIRRFIERISRDSEDSLRKK